jgi:hypothetical protein
MDHSADDRRWVARRKFWFPSGILVDRRAGHERRTGSDRRRTASGLPPGLTIDRRSEPRRATLERRTSERRVGPRRPPGRPSEA